MQNAQDLLQPEPRTEKKRLSMSLFRRSRGPSPSPSPSPIPTPGAPELDDGKKGRFSLFRQSGRRSGLVLDAALFRFKAPSPSAPSSASSSDAPSDRGSEGGGRQSAESVSDERSRALSILEGRAVAEEASPTTPAAGGETRTDTQSTASTPTGSPLPTPTSFISALSRPGSTSSRRSLSVDGRRASSRLGLVPENTSTATSTGTTILTTTRLTEEPEKEGTDEHALPTYASAAYPKRPATYRFAQAGPFAMTLAASGEEVPGLGRYHVSVGVNVWAPRSYVTSIRRGLGEDGPLVAQIEAGCASVNATVAFGDVGLPLKDMMSKNLVNGSRQYNVGDGSTVNWKLGRTEWKAYFDSAHIATFSPTAPRTLVIQPTAHRLMDHLLIGVLLLMREKDEAVYGRTDYAGMQMHLTPFA
ncbi:hypothetical protein K466DRAFT_588489 [Polyporus arcularius HHB13444]|uniref:Uncharacterized protein n=1 Tax=Polyporus arcularius HHB13444 TaxID=1314778 RepID=A0A5C3P6Q9_9APHY|nr:hypothetical protein K466DRAFT_588489 [Polyporus arcularius HHB13444]